MARTTEAKVTIDDSEVLNLLRRLRNEAPHLAAGAVEKTSLGLLDSLKNDWLNRAGSGRLYPSARGSGMHRASAPGEPPAPDTNTYRQSWQEARASADGLQRVVFTNEERATRLEYGDNIIAPRPHALPATVAHKRFFIGAVKEAARHLERIRG